MRTLPSIEQLRTNNHKISFIYSNCGIIIFSIFLQKLLALSENLTDQVNLHTLKKQRVHYTHLFSFLIHFMRAGIPHYLVVLLAFPIISHLSNS